MSNLIYIDKLGTDAGAFAAKVLSIAQLLKVDPQWLMQVMYRESGLNPKAVNQYSGATGLIQFMPSTAEGLGTTTTALRNMSAVQQLDYVYKYFKGYTGKMHSYYDVYAVVFFPALIGKPDTWVLQTAHTSAATIARQNPDVDVNKDGVITVADFKAYVKNTVNKNNWDIVFADVKKKPTSS